MAASESKEENTNTNDPSSDPSERRSRDKKRLLKRRPITLIGYGIGARVIIHCLETLVTEYKSYSNKDYILGLVENVVLMGTPFGTNTAAWMELKSIIPGRFINCYSTRDWLLALMFRQCTWEIGVAGLGPIELSTASDSEKQAVPVAVNEAESCSHEDRGADISTVDAVSQTPVDTRDALSPITNSNQSIENMDVTALIRSHADYPNALQLIIPLLHLEQ